ncbi:uncharacterized protein LOC143284979 [Babylonia areolata]|uniref:uncharacterized protein LOC143284979 n=1 Tax=Babylonia areolata TaxID=304850 RepID=UPI003FD62391
MMMTMRIILCVMCVCWGVLGTRTQPLGRADVTPDPFLGLLRDIESQPFFRTLSDAHRVLTFEMLTAAETNNLAPLLDTLGYVELLQYLDALPADFSHTFITYCIQRLEQEQALQTS